MWLTSAAEVGGHAVLHFPSRVRVGPCRRWERSPGLGSGHGRERPAHTSAQGQTAGLGRVHRSLHRVMSSCPRPPTGGRACARRCRSGLESDPSHHICAYVHRCRCGPGPDPRHPARPHTGARALCASLSSNMACDTLTHIGATLRKSRMDISVGALPARAQPGALHRQDARRGVRARPEAEARMAGSALEPAQALLRPTMTCARSVSTGLNVWACGFFASGAPTHPWARSPRPAGA